MATQIGPKIGIDGEKEYRQQIRQIIDQTKTLDSAMQKTASEWNKNTSAMTKNKAIAQNLTQSISLQKEKIAAMNQMLEQATEKFGEGSSAAMAWQRAVDQATISLNNMQSELNNLHGAAGFSELQTQMADIGTTVQNFGQKMTSLGQSLTATLTLPLVAAGAAAVKLASDTEEAANKVDVVFGTMSEQVKQFADDALNSYGLAEGSALQMAGTFGAMATSMGLSQAEAANMSTSLTALAADMASFYNVSTDIAQTSLQGVFTGETEALKKFGIVMTQTNLEDFAAQQGKVYSQMSEAEKVMTRYAFVMNATADAQGDFGRTADGTANSFRVLQESLKELASAFGQSLLPIITPLIQRLTAIVQAFAKLPEPIKRFIVVIGLIVAAVGPVLVIIGTLMTSLGGIITQGPIIAAAFISMIPAIQGLAASFVELTVAAAPWLLLAAAIAAAGYLIYSNWDSISAGISNAASSISEAYHRLMDLNNSLKESVNSFVESFVSSIAKLPTKVVNALKETVTAIKNEFKQMIQNAKKSGADFVNGFIDGIKSKVQGLINQVQKIAETIEEYLGFSCPEKGALSKYETWMPDFMNGLAKGIYSNMGVVKAAVSDVAKTMTLPLDSGASMNMALAGSGAGGASASLGMGGTTMNIYVDHISELNDLLKIQNQAQQRLRMGAKQ